MIGRDWEFITRMSFFFCGYSNSGKTTLMASCIEKLSQKYDVGCVKHCSHSFDFDREGKDSWKFSRAGAQEVLLNAPSHWAGYFKHELSKYEKNFIFTQVDFVLAEGAKQEKGNKILVLDDQHKILELLRQGEITGVKALASKEKPQDTCGLPWFQRDDIDAVCVFIEEQLKASIAPLKGLLLSGGKSSRMGRDKAWLEYHGKSQIEYMYEMLSLFCDEVYVSCGDAADYPGFPEDRYLKDSFNNLGPLNGILSALSYDAQSAWLVSAVDLPFVSEEVINDLVSKRNPFKVATAYRSNFKEFPEPLFTVYEPHSRHQIFKYMGLGFYCPRKVLINSDVQLLDQGEKHWLDNANTAEEYEAVCAKLKTL